MKIYNLIDYKKPKYKYIQVIPSTSIRNNRSDKIIHLISNLYIDIWKTCEFINKKLRIYASVKVGYYIYMEKHQAFFYFVIPESHYAMFREKIQDIWSNVITLAEVDDIPIFSKDCTKYAMKYYKEDAMSLSCDKRDNLLLSSILSTLEVMEEDDKCGIFYNFIPINQRSFRAKHDNTIERLTQGMPIDKNKNTWYSVKKIAIMLFSILEDFFQIKSTIQKRDLNLLDETKTKRDKRVVDTQILCLSQSSDKKREVSNAISLCESFNIITGDNELLYQRYKGNVDFNNLLIADIAKNVMQPRECQNLLSLPARELLEQFPNIIHNNVYELSVPEVLQKGYISIGECTYKGKKTKAYFSEEKDIVDMPVVLVGEQGSGKTTYICNYVTQVQKKGEGVILIDYIKNCELSEDIKKNVPKENIIELDLSDVKNAQGIGYNELKPKSNDIDDILDVVNRKALYMQLLIDALNNDGGELTSLMDRYLSAALNIVMLDENASLKDIVRCLNDAKYRQSILANIKNPYIRDTLDEEISALEELTDEKGETKQGKINGINHRVYQLQKDLRLKYMYKKDCSHNIDIIKAMDEGKVILVKMPQEYFPTRYTKNVITTYWITKIWAAMLVRGGRELHPKRVHVIVDEIFQAKTAMEFLSNDDIPPQTRKFHCKFVFSCQYIEQIKKIDQTFRSAGASYMFLKGSGKANFNEFKDELAPFTLEDMENLKQYHSLNLINTTKNRVKFITALPYKKP